METNNVKMSSQEWNLSDSAIANEVQLLENFNLTKNKLKDILGAMPILDENTDSFEEFQAAIAHEIEQFLEKYPINETDEIKTSLERFTGNYPYLELYRGLSLHGAIIIDFALNFPSQVDISSIIVDMLPKLWHKNESIEAWQNRIGYYGFIRHILSTQALYNANRDQSISINELLSTHLYMFNEADLTRKLQKEDTYKKQQQIDLSGLNARTGLIENIMNFEIYSQKNENLLQHVFSYSMNMNRLIHFKNPTDIDRTCLQEILEIDLFSLIGEIMFDENANVALKDIESIVCNLNTNLLHVIIKNTCPIISICDKFSSNPKDDLNEILQLLTKNKENSADEDNDRPETTSRKPFKIKSQDILDYVRHHNELMAYLLEKIHGLESDDRPEIELNCQLLDNIMQMEEISIRTDASEESDRMLAALNFDAFGLEFARELISKGNYR